jgi:hypothetical protein
LSARLKNCVTGVVVAPAQAFNSIIPLLPERNAMHRKFKHLILLSALVAVTSLAMAEDPPARVARVSVVEGQVTVLEPDGDEAGGNLVNWPVTSGTRITAAPGARTEFRVGSTAVRLDGDSSMEVIDLDDNVLRLRLDYGTANVRIRNPDQLSGFELTTPQARVTMAEPGSLRIDAERAPDTSVVTMLAGSGRVDGAGTSMSLRAGKRVEIRGDDIFTGVAQRTAFDDWVHARDRRDDNSQSLRYVTADVTGYEELDQYGNWRDDPEYGPLWAPRGVGADWAPYRDGRWTWLEPWGWTWVDDAPWGYAPSHYGRWVFVQSRWYWAPGRAVVRPVWAPALVGWVGGSGWNVTFRDHRAGPGVGWYPLTPRDRYVPSYRVSVEHERRLEWQHNGKVRWKEDPRHDGRRDGVTVLPREYFERRSIVNVGREPRVLLAPGDVRKAPLVAAPPVAAPLVNRPGRVIETRRDGREDRRDDWRERHGDGQRPQVGQPVPGNALQGQPQRVMPGVVVQQPGVMQDDRRRFDRPGRDDGDRERRDERGRINQPQPQALQPGQLPQQNAGQQMQERQRQEYQRQDQQRQEFQRQDRQRQEAQHQEQQRQEAQRQDQQRQEVQRQERLRQDGQRQEQQRQEAQRQEQQRQDVQRQQEAQRQEAQRQEQQRQRQEIQQRQDAQRQEQQRQEMQRQEQQRQEAQRQEMQRQDQQRRELREAMRQQAPQPQPRPEARPQQQAAPTPEARRAQREENRENKDGRNRKAQE